MFKKKKSLQGVQKTKGRNQKKYMGKNEIKVFLEHS